MHCFQRKNVEYFYLELNGNSFVFQKNEIHHVQVKIFENQEKENFMHLTA